MKVTDPFDGAAGLLLPLVTAQLQSAVNIHLSVVGPQDEESVGAGQDEGCVTNTFINPYSEFSSVFVCHNNQVITTSSTFPLVHTRTLCY